MASVTGQCPSQPEMHENRAEYDTGRLYLVDGVGRGTTAASIADDCPPLAAGTPLSSRSGHRPEPRITSPFAGFLKRAALVTVAEVGVSTARVSLEWRPRCGGRSARRPSHVDSSRRTSKCRVDPGRARAPPPGALPKGAVGCRRRRLERGRLELGQLAFPTLGPPTEQSRRARSLPRDT